MYGDVWVFVLTYTVIYGCRGGHALHALVLRSAYFVID